MLHTLLEYLTVEFPDLTPLPTSCDHVSLDLCSPEIEILSLSGDDDLLQIHTLYTTEPSKGIGRRIVRIILQYCQDECRVPIAVGVDSEAEEAWEDFGFIPIAANTRDWVHHDWAEQYYESFA